MPLQNFSPVFGEVDPETKADPKRAEKEQLSRSLNPVAKSHRDSPTVAKRDERSIEDRMGLDLATADGRQLLLYFANRFQESHGYEYHLMVTKERAIMTSFKERYGPDAGPMVALLFDEYQGWWEGQVATITAFTQGAKWIQDILYTTLQEKRKTEVEATEVSGRLENSSEFLASFGSVLETR